MQILSSVCFFKQLHLRLEYRLLLRAILRKFIPVLEHLHQNQPSPQIVPATLATMSDEHRVGAFNTKPSDNAPTTSPAVEECPDSRGGAGDQPPAPVPELDAIEKIRNFFETKFGFNATSGSETESGDEGAVASGEGPPRQLKTVDMEGLVKHWKGGGFKRIVTMVGAGISTSAGIPDFRSPGTGLYNNLKKYALPYPTAIFELDYFVHKPKPFFALAKELYPGQFKPTPSHYFIRLLSDKGLLQRHYTQNIDTLDRIAGIPPDKLVEAHGTFHTNHCVRCRHEHSQAWVKAEIFADRVPKCQKCTALVKPDIVFFGENLPARFYELPETDFAACDLLIVMGTSLEVHPFAGLVELVGNDCVRLLINREAVGLDGGSWLEGFQFGRKRNQRDVLMEGDCDAGVWRLAEQLGWREELEELIRVELAELEKADTTDPVEVSCDSSEKKLGAEVGKSQPKLKD